MNGIIILHAISIDCTFKFPFVVKARKQIRHLKGRAPVILHYGFWGQLMQIYLYGFGNASVEHL